MIDKYFQGKIPQSFHKTLGLDLMDLNKELKQKVNEQMKDYNFSLALAKIWEVINAANKFIEETKPWVLFKENKKKELNDFIFVLVCVINNVAVNIDCFMPETAAKIKNQFGQTQIKKDKPLFPRIEKIEDIEDCENVD